MLTKSIKYLLKNESQPILDETINSENLQDIDLIENLENQYNSMIYNCKLENLMLNQLLNKFSSLHLNYELIQWITEFISTNSINSMSSINSINSFKWNIIWSNEVILYFHSFTENNLDVYTSSIIYSEDLYNYVLSTKKPHFQPTLIQSNESNLIYKSVVNIPIIINQKIICVLEGLFCDSELTIELIYDQFSWYFNTIIKLCESLINHHHHHQNNNNSENSNINKKIDSIIISDDFISLFQELSNNSHESNLNLLLSNYYSKLIDLLYSSIHYSDYFISIGIFYLNDKQTNDFYNGYIMTNSNLKQLEEKFIERKYSCNNFKLIEYLHKNKIYTTLENPTIYYGQSIIKNCLLNEDIITNNDKNDVTSRFHIILQIPFIEVSDNEEFKEKGERNGENKIIISYHYLIVESLLPLKNSQIKILEFILQQSNICYNNKQYQ